MLRTPSYMKGENPWFCCVQKWVIDSIWFLAKLRLSKFIYNPLYFLLNMNRRISQELMNLALKVKEKTGISPTVKNSF